MTRRIPQALIAIVFCVALAAGALTGCSAGVGSDIPEPSGVATETTETAVFYSTGRSLLEERKIVDADEMYEATLRELLRALPESNPDVAIVQPEADFNSVTLGSDGVITIDWKPEVLDFEAEDKEKRLAFASLLMTMGGFPEVEKVRFTVDGKDTGEIEGRDVEAFWGAVSLKGQPFKALRPPTKKSKGEILEEQTTGAQESGEDEPESAE